MSLGQSEHRPLFPTGGVALSALMALLAAGALLTLFLASKIVGVLMLGALGFVFLFTIAGNQRLFCLWGAILTAPLAVAKNFAIAPHMGGAAAYSIEPLDVFLVILLAFILRDLAKGKRPPLRWSPVAFWWGGMIALGFVSMLLGPLRQLSAQEVLRMAKCFLLFFVIVNEALRAKQIMQVAVALIACVALQTGTALVQGAFHVDLGLQVLGEASQETIKYTTQATYAGGDEGGFRVNGLLGHPNLLAAFLSMLLPICVALAFARIPRLARLMLVPLTIAGGLALLLTLSRTGWLTFGVAFAILFAYSFVHPRLRTRFVFARIAAIGALGVGVLLFSDKIVRRLYESDPGALNFRYEWNQVAWQFVQQHPVFGIGLNTFIYHLPGATKYGGVQGLTERFGEQWPAAHNIYLLTWSEQGTAGFVFFVGLNLYLLFTAFRNTGRYVDDRIFAVNIGCMAGLVSMMIDGLTSFYIRNPAPARVFWIVAALIVAIDYWNRANGPLLAKAAAARAGARTPVAQAT